MAILSYAQEQSPSPSAEVSPSPTESAAPSPTEQPSPSGTVTPSPSGSAGPVESSTSSPTSQPEVLTTLSPTPNESPNPPPTEEPTPTPLVTTSSEEGVITAVLYTDKADYAPTEIALIFGNNFTPNETYTLNITSDIKSIAIGENKLLTLVLVNNNYQIASISYLPPKK